MHVAFILPNLMAGGTERVTLDLIGGFVARGARVDLVLMEAQGEFLLLVPAGVRVVDLGAKRLRDAVLPLRRYFKAERPDAALAAMWPLTTATVLAAAGLGPRPRIVVADHAPLLDQYAASPGTIAALKVSVRASYRFADAVVAATQGLSEETAGLARLPRERVMTIYNPIPASASAVPPVAPWPSGAGKRILSVGRLKAGKNFHLVIEAFAALTDQPDSVLAIVGDGPELPALQTQVARFGLAGRVLLPGYTATPGDWYREADLFVLASDFEGFGNVLIEAMHFGADVVSTDCRYGPRELLGGGRWGTLTPCGDAAALTAAIRATLAQPRDSAAQAARAAEFSVERAVDAYWQALAA